MDSNTAEWKRKCDVKDKESELLQVRLKGAHAALDAEVYLCVYIYTCIFTFMFMYVCISAYVYMYMCFHKCVCKYYVNIYQHVCI